MTTRKTTTVAEDEFGRRVDGEREKAVRKYGQDALLPAGRPDYDVADYAVNELVGLVRYGEMIAERGKMMRDLMDEGLKPSTHRAIRAQIVLGRKIAAAGRELGVALIEIRQTLKADGLILGTTERTAG